MFGGDVFRHRDANVRDADREEPTVERHSAGGLDGVRHIVRILAKTTDLSLLADIKLAKLRKIEREEIQRIGHDSLLHEHVRDASAQRLHIERVARAEMLKPSLQLRRAGRIDAPCRHLALQSFDRTTADGTDRRHLKDLLGARALFGDDGVNRRNDIAGLDEPDVVADTDVLTDDLVGVVQRRTGNRGTREVRRTELGNRRQDARAPDLDGNRLDDRLRTLGRVLVGTRPAGTVRGRSEDIVEPTLVDLDDRAVDFKAKGMSKLLKLVNRRKHLLECLDVL